jgi:hypothetical protein
VSATNTAFDASANWSPSGAPANSDTLIFSNLGAANCTTNTTTVLTGLTIIKEKSYTGQIGTLSGATSTYLTFETGTVHLEQTTGQSSGSGSALAMFEGNTSMTAYVYDSCSTSASTYYPPILLKSAALTLHQTGGTVGVAALPTETATLTAATITKGGGSVSPSLYCGSGCTQTYINAKNGTILSRSAQTAANTTITGDATYTTEGSGAHTTINCYDNGTVNYGCTGTVSTLNLTGTWNSEKYSQSYTVTDRNFGPAARYFINNGRANSVTHTNAYVLTSGAGIQNIQARTPPGKNL